MQQTRGMFLSFGYPHAILKPDEIKTWEEWIFGEAITFLDKPPPFVPSATTLYPVFTHNNAAMVLVDVDPADLGVWAAEVGMLDDQSDQFRSAWELVDHFVSG